MNSSTAESSPARKPTWRWLLIAALLVFPAWWLYRGLVPPPLVVSPETTVITSPLLPDGRPDYVTYLNQKYSAGVTSENNAAVFLERLFQWSPFPSEYQPADFERLGIPVPSENDLIVSWEKFASEQHIEAAHSEVLKEVVEDSRSYSRDQHPEIAEFLASNQKPLDLAMAVLRRSRCYRPIADVSGQGLQGCDWLPRMSETRDLARMLSLRARYRRQTGDLSGAMTDLLAIVRLGRLTSENGFLLSLSVGGLVEGMAASHLEDILLRDNLDVESVQHIRRELAALPPPASVAEAFDVSERMFYLDQLCLLRSGRLDPDWGLKLQLGVNINELLRTVNRSLDELVEIARIQDLRTRRLALARWQSKRPSAELPFWVVKWIEYFGRAPTVTIRASNVTAECHPNVSLAIESADRMLVKRALLQSSLSLAEFRAVHARFPDSLDQLVPDFEEVIPRDPWADGPLRYEVREGGFTLWSVGPNQLDDGGWNRGDSPSDYKEADDIRFGIKPTVAPVARPAENSSK